MKQKKPRVAASGFGTDGGLKQKEMIMQRANIVLAVLFCCLLGAAALQAQEATNAYELAPATKLEAFETNVGTIIIKASTDLGVVSGKAGAISVKCKEFTDTATGRKEHGISIEIARPGQFKDVMLVDYDELSSLVGAIDYLYKLDVSVSSLETFDAAYTTKGGLRIAALGTRRTGLVQFGVRDIRINATPVVLSRDEMTRLSSLINQAKAQLDGLRG
jgi:hypothetical protein